MRTETTLTVALALALTSGAAAHGDPADRDRQAVDLAVCLDTSGSMEGLLDAARRNIWAIANDLALAKPTPRLRIALITFGNDGHDPVKGWVRVDMGFTDDLDEVSEKLFALTTNGGSEFVARAMQTALRELEWSADDDALKLMLVAGNESAEQDPDVDFRATCKVAIESGVLVNSIYCGNPSDAIAPAWRDVATLADGRFASIDQDQGDVVIATPFDDQLTALSAKVNTTYVPYGEAGKAASEKQTKQDENAEKLGKGVAAQRAWAKCTSNYMCASWDLVDAIKNGTVQLAKLDAATLPEAMQAMTLPQRQAFLDGKSKARASIQAEMARLNTARLEFVATELRKRADDLGASFEFAVRQAVRAQAEARGFAFPAAAVAVVTTDEGDGR